MWSEFGIWGNQGWGKEGVKLVDGDRCHEWGCFHGEEYKIVRKGSMWEGRSVCGDRVGMSYVWMMGSKGEGEGKNEWVYKLNNAWMMVREHESVVRKEMWLWGKEVRMHKMHEGNRVGEDKSPEGPEEREEEESWKSWNTWEWGFNFERGFIAPRK